jgi:hypothetical protein
LFILISNKSLPMVIGVLAPMSAQRHHDDFAQFVRFRIFFSWFTSSAIFLLFLMNLSPCLPLAT